MYRSHLRKVGNSTMLAIPKPLLESLDLHENTPVGLSVADGRLVIEPLRRPKYTMAELIAECDLSAPMTEEDRVWLDDLPVGREEI